MYDMYFDFSFYQQHVVNWAFSSLRSLTLGQDAKEPSSWQCKDNCGLLFYSCLYNLKLHTNIHNETHEHDCTNQICRSNLLSAVIFSSFHPLALWCRMVGVWHRAYFPVFDRMTQWAKKSFWSWGKASGPFDIMTNLPQNESMLAIYYSAGKEPCGTDWFQQLCPPASSIICFTNWQFLLNGRGHEYDVFN